MQQIALFVCLALVLWLFARDIRRRPTVSPALWFVFIWVVIIGSRAVSTWLDAGRVVGSADVYDEGNPLERNVYLTLLASGLATLARRGIRLGQVIRQNRWLSIFFVYWLFSVLWTELPFVAFKRWIKDTGNVIMVLVILTDKDPVEAAKAVFVRCAFLLLPISVLFIRYYPELGRAYDPAGGMMFTGVATQKNTLGVLALVGGLFLAWDCLSRRKAMRSVDRTQWLVDLSLLGMALWLLLKSRSATSLACAIIAAGILLALQWPAIRARINRIEIYAIAGAALFWLLNSVFDLYGFIIVDVLGRDLTLTSRTEVWPVLVSYMDNPFFGAGFMGFWTGATLSTLYEQYGILQAHSGYLELYLNGGLVALFLFGILIVTSSRNIKRQLLLGDDFAMMRLILLVVGLAHNYAEASISKGGLIWFVLLLALARYRTNQALKAGVRVSRRMESRPAREIALGTTATCGALG